MITFFTTGGTFDKVYFDANSEFSIGDTQVSPILEEGNVTAEYQVKELLRKDSLEITDNDRAVIAQQVIDCESSHIIITHGTDTMSDTAKVIAEACKHQSQKKTIVLVGAMQPARLRVTDAPFNLGFALAAVQLLPADIYIAMNGNIFHHSNVTKNLSKARFETLNNSVFP